eukprot:EG_transcript_19144
MIHDIQMDFHGQLIATCSSDQTVKIFAPQGSGQPYQHVQTLKGHDGPVWAVGWAHPKFGGSHLASCSYDHKIIIWKEAAHHHWSKHYEHKKHNGSVNALSWGPHELGLCLAAASSDGTVSILYKGDEQWSDYSIDAHPGGCNAVSWAPYLPAGSILTLAAGKSGAASSRRIVSAGCDHKVKVWKFTDKAGSLAASTWELEATLQEHTDWVRDVQWAGNIGLPVSYIASCGQDGKVVVWTQKAEGDTWEGEVILQGDGPQWHVSWSELGNLLAVSGSNNQVSLWRQMPNGAWKRVSNLAPADPQ